MQDSNHVLSDLYLSFIRGKVDIDSVVTADGVSMEDSHPPGGHIQPFGQDKVFSGRQKQMTIVVHWSVLVFSLLLTGVQGLTSVRFECSLESHWTQGSFGCNGFRVKHDLLLVGWSIKHVSDFVE